MNLYNLKRSGTGFMLAKFDPDFNVEAVYEMSPKRPGADPMKADAFTCNCPAGPRPSCKHRKMIFTMRKNVDTEWFYCYETQKWHRPLDPVLGEAPAELPPSAVPYGGPPPEPFEHIVRETEEPHLPAPSLEDLTPREAKAILDADATGLEDEAPLPDGLEKDEADAGLVQVEIPVPMPPPAPPTLGIRRRV